MNSGKREQLLVRFGICYNTRTEQPSWAVGASALAEAFLRARLESTIIIDSCEAFDPLG